MKDSCFDLRVLCTDAFWMLPRCNCQIYEFECFPLEMFMRHCIWQECTKYWYTLIIYVTDNLGFINLIIFIKYFVECSYTKTDMQKVFDPLWVLRTVALLAAVALMKAAMTNDDQVQKCLMAEHKIWNIRWYIAYCVVWNNNYIYN